MPEKIATLVVDIEGRVGKLENAMKRAENRSQKAATKISNTFKRMGTTLSAAFGGLFVFNELRKGAKAFVELDKGMRLVNTITKVTDVQMKILKAEVIDLSTELGTPTSQMTGAMYQAVSAGVAFNDVMEFMRVATKGAVAGNADVETSVDALTTVMNSWGIQMSEINDVADTMFKTIELGKTTMSELAASYSLVAPLAAASGVSFQELSAAIGVLTAAGTPTSQAMTQLSAIIVALKKNLGETIFEQNTFTEALELGRDAYKLSGKTLTEYLGRKEAELALLGLTGSKTKDLAKATEEIGKRSGAAATAFEEMEKSIAKNIQNLKVALEKVLTKLVQIKDFIGDSSELQFFLKALATPLVVGQGGEQTGAGELNLEKERIARDKIRIQKLMEIIASTDNLKVQKALNKELSKYVGASGDARQQMRDLQVEIKTSGDAWEDINNEVIKVEDGVKKIFDEQKRLQALNDSGLLSVEEWRKNEAEIVALGIKLTGELDKQSTFIEDILGADDKILEKIGLIKTKLEDVTLSKSESAVLTNAQKTLEGELLDIEIERLKVVKEIADNFVAIAESTMAGEAIGTGQAGLEKSLTPEFLEGRNETRRQEEWTDTFESIKASMAEAENSANNMDQKFFSILNAGATLSSILNIGAHTFIGVLLSGLNAANSIANSIFGIISAFSGGGAGGILGFLFGGGLAGEARAEGGEVKRGRPYKVGEKGEELFVPTENGKIIPNSKLKSSVINESFETNKKSSTSVINEAFKTNKKLSSVINKKSSTSIINKVFETNKKLLNSAMGGSFEIDTNLSNSGISSGLITNYLNEIKNISNVVGGKIENITNERGNEFNKKLLTSAMGGRFEGGKKIEGFAMGGGGIVPPGFPDDSFPLMVQSGEQVDITPIHKVGGTETAIKQLNTSLNNIISNMAVNDSGGVVRVPVSIDGKQIFEVVQEHSNRATRSGINLDEF